MQGSRSASSTCGFRALTGISRTPAGTGRRNDYQGGFCSRTFRNEQDSYIEVLILRDIFEAVEKRALYLLQYALPTAEQAPNRPPVGRTIDYMEVNGQSGGPCTVTCDRSNASSLLEHKGGGGWTLASQRCDVGPWQVTIHALTLLLAAFYPNVNHATQDYAQPSCSLLCEIVRLLDFSGALPPF